MKIVKTLILLLSANFLIVTTAIAANSTNNNQPTAKQKQEVDQLARGYLGDEMFESLYYGACKGLFLCDCINTPKGQEVIGSGADYERVKRICKAVAYGIKHHEG
ncbi:MAG: hypothetical protein P1U63_06800 [Coxiellaceae bacterium]|nr:hypothetical protein [Coxiellaceae bacterium]